MWMLVGGIAAAFFAGAARGPKTKVKKYNVHGARSGRLYHVEEFPDAGFLVAKAPDGTLAVYRRDPSTRALAFTQGKGREQSMKLLREDFEPPPAP